MGQMFLRDTAAINFQSTFTTPESRQMSAPVTKSAL